MEYVGGARKKAVKTIVLFGGTKVVATQPTKSTLGDLLAGLSGIKCRRKQWYTH